jgi:hypothetical protein
VRTTGGMPADAIAAAAPRIDALSMRVKPFVVLACGAALAAGCGQSKEEKAMADVCDARADMSKQVDTLKGLTASTVTTTKVTDSLKAIRDDLSKIADARGDLSDARRDQVQAANDQFAGKVRDTLATVARTVSAEDAKAQLTQAAQDLAGTYKGTYGKIDCSDT